MPRHYYLAIFLAAVLNVSPFFFQHLGADTWELLTWMRCFSEQFWQGDLYPRWCMDVNSGLGTPLFLFYFPLPFTIAALFHPLVTLGLSYYGLFAFLCFLASFLAIISAYSWLRDIVTAPVALLASIILVFLPYHLEMMVFRGAYAEMWSMVFVPLLFKYVRRIVRGESRCVAKLALVVGALLLTHVPVTLSALLFGGVYVLVMTGKAWQPKIQCLTGVLWGVALAAFYLIPAQYYQHFLANFLAAPNVIDGLKDWPNHYFTAKFFALRDLQRPLVAMLLNGLLLAGFSIVVVVRRMRIEDGFVRREMKLWVGISAVAFFMVFPLSAPLYALMGPLAKMLFPWRMQMIVIIGITYMIAVWMQWQIRESRRKTWKMDYGLALFFLWILGYCLAASFSPAGVTLSEKIREAKIVDPFEYRSQWTDAKHWGYEYLLAYPTSPIASIAKGDGKIEVRQWNVHGIEVATDSIKPIILRINHGYFPVWQGRIDSTISPVHPEDKTGLILVDVPAGKHLVMLTIDVSGGVAYLVAAKWLSIAAWIGLVLTWARPKFFDRKALA